MPSTFDYDIVIAGASFAGAACALAAARAGLRVLVLERKTDPGDKLHTTGILVKEAIEQTWLGRAPADCGDVTVRLEPRASALAISVADQGPGIPDYALPRVFERFYSLPRPHGADKSTGLGLCFAREVATLHHGEVTLANRPGGGALAELTLPAG